ncbi:MAG: class I SAM-dependent methyltransferase [Verrucomicrobiae bacterium]|nr:class I SAM-dependent methyltransferase [Verrucomicrobiae bacterium]
MFSRTPSRQNLKSVVPTVSKESMVAEERNWYDTPLYYDIAFGAGTEAESDFIEKIHQQFGRTACQRRQPRLLEPACGSGRLVEAMAQRGWNVSGFDVSREGIAFAHERMGKADLKARLWRDRLEYFKVPGRCDFDLSHCLVSTFKYLSTEADACSHLRLIGDCLRPGGIYLLGIHLTDYSRSTTVHERWVSTRDGIQVVCNTRIFPSNPGLRMERLRCRLSVTENGETRLQETNWQSRTYNAQQLKHTLCTALPDFTVVACHDFHHDIEITRPFDDSYSDIVVVLRKNDH